MNMCLVNRLYIYIATVCCFAFEGTYAFNGYIVLTDDGPTVQGGVITFRADLYSEDGTKARGEYDYEWRDNAIPVNTFRTKSNATSIWSVHYPAKLYPVGEYNVEVNVKITYLIISISISQHRSFKITPTLNGNMVILQSNNSIKNNFVSSASEANVRINIRDGDAKYINTNATEISTYWFVDCEYYGQTNDYTFNYNFTKPNTTSTIEALIVASLEPLTTTSAPTTTTTTTVAPITTTTTTTKLSPPSPPENGTASFNSTTIKPIVTNTKSSISLTTTSTKITTPTATLKSVQTNNSMEHHIYAKDLSLPFVCINSSIIPLNPDKVYGYFHKQVKVRAPISNIVVDGTNWIKRWDLLSLNVTCHGTGPITRCLQYYQEHYNITGNETCDDGTRMESCNFSIRHYFLDSNVYTILMILKNDISTEIYPLTVNIYKVIPKPQLSVIVVPVTCSLVAVVLIVFGIAYYIQSRARFTVEVADFDFGQNYPEMEYKTFTERLRDSLNSTGYKPLDNPEIPQN